MSDNLRTDIADAKAKMRVKIGGGREIKKLEGHLWEGEQVDRMTTGNYGKGIGLVVLTDRRLLFVQEGMMSQSTEDFPIDKVSSVSWSSGFSQGTIIIYASGNKAEIKSVHKDDGKEIVDVIRHRLSAPAAPPAPAARESVADPMEQLRKLGELRDAGILSDDEFTAKKADILSRL